MLKLFVSFGVGKWTRKTRPRQSIQISRKGGEFTIKDQIKPNETVRVWRREQTWQWVPLLGVLSMLLLLALVASFRFMHRK